VIFGYLERCGARRRDLPHAFRCLVPARFVLEKWVLIARFIRAAVAEAVASSDLHLADDDRPNRSALALAALDNDVAKVMGWKHQRLTHHGTRLSRRGNWRRPNLADMTIRKRSRTDLSCVDRLA
jgi:hypothetical protein